MAKPTFSAAGDLLTQLILEVFQLNGQLLAEGDRLTADLGLTSARWQVMGAIGDEAIPVVQIAKKMGLRRQSVQRLVNVLAEAEIVEFQENPNHQRAKLVKLTEMGRYQLQQISQIQGKWVNDLSNGLDTQQLKNALILLQEIRKKLQ
jgi:DNA-binding MarR family transcriptional regulator